MGGWDSPIYIWYAVHSLSFFGRPLLHETEADEAKISVQLVKRFR